ncbi:neurotrimin-like [Neocloeon triangulifer]|uniref:neurotrimin-like n=1 Tax=Neocloeon triangulifer TaxID=2078957 RepID=UPI00286EF95B|nr:neurotrimin-like [Neocloeon triangulifer]XP_059489845.1 neurotrimin-like [Neocloeon triangulifer]
MTCLTTSASSPVIFVACGLASLLLLLPSATEGIVKPPPPPSHNSGGQGAQQQQPPQQAAAAAGGAAPKSFWYDFTSPFTESYDDQEAAEANTEESPGADEVTTEPLPFFEDVDAGASNVTAQLGSTATLHCRVNDLRDKTVSWVRRHGEELRLITFGLHTYISDSRFALMFEAPNNWRLQIRYATARDQGHYECQVSSHPPRVLQVLLTVVAPRVEIVDERGVPIVDKFYKTGSTIELKCVISQVPHPSTYVTWKHGQRMLNYDTSRGGISVKTDILSSGATSFLYIANANQHDSGNYTCALTDVAEATISVHVLNGESPAAMQHSGGGLLLTATWPLWPLGLVTAAAAQLVLCEHRWHR